MTNKAYPKSINAKLTCLKEEKRKTLDLMQAASFAERLQKDFPELIQGISIDTYFDYNVSVRVFPKKLSDLATLLRAMRQAGYQMQKDGIKDYPDSAMRIYKLTNRMEVTAHFTTSLDEKKDDSEDNVDQDKEKHCRYVKVGEKRETVVKPIYELQCEKQSTIIMKGERK